MGSAHKLFPATVPMLRDHVVFWRMAEMRRE